MEVTRINSYGEDPFTSVGKWIIKKTKKIKQYQQNKKQKTKKIYLKERIPIKFKLPSFKWKKQKNYDININY